MSELLFISHVIAISKNKENIYVKSQEMSSEDACTLVYFQLYFNSVTQSYMPFSFLVSSRISLMCCNIIK
jgi:hypothetical protein